MTIYDYPQYYEVAFSHRDFRQESEYLQACFKRFSNIEVKRLLEIACGPALHAKHLSEYGYQYVGIDINRNMLDHAAYQTCQLSPRPEFVEADMKSFRLTEQVDFAFVLLGSLYVNGDQEMHEHFDSLASSLRPGGLYLLDWCIQFIDPIQTDVPNSIINENDGIRVESKFDIRMIDPVEHMYEEIWTLNVNDRGRHKKFEMIERNRALLPDQFLLFLQQRQDFEFVGWWTDWEMKTPITDTSEIIHPVVLVRRK